LRVALQGEQPQAKGAAEGERESCATRAGDVFAFGQLLRWLRGTQAKAEEVEAEEDVRDVETLLAALCSQSPAARPTAAEALRHRGWARVCR